MPPETPTTPLPDSAKDRLVWLKDYPGQPYVGIYLMAVPRVLVAIDAGLGRFDLWEMWKLSSPEIEACLAWDRAGRPDLGGSK